MISWHIHAWNHYEYWLENDIKIARKISKIVQETYRQPFSGLGKPEPLKNEYKGYWSRRINKEHRLLYKFENGVLIISSCRYHYND